MIHNLRLHHLHLPSDAARETQERDVKISIDQRIDVEAIIMIGIGLHHPRKERESTRGGIVRVLHLPFLTEIGDIRRRRGGRLRIKDRGGRMVDTMLGEEVLEVDLEEVIEGELGFYWLILTGPYRYLLVSCFSWLG